MDKFFESRLQSNQILDPSLRKLKKALEHALAIFERASQKEMIDFASKVPPSPFFNSDILNLAGKNIINLEEIWSDINNQIDVMGLLTSAQKLLDAKDDPVLSVLSFCVAVELSEALLKSPVPIILENRNFAQLAQMAQQNGGAVIDAVRKEVEQSLRVGVVRNP